MNWRGLWTNNDQYFFNDVAVSPANASTYILTGQKAVFGGNDPSTSPLWSELSAITTGVASIIAGSGIDISYPLNPQVPVITNTGCLTVQVSSGIANDGTETEPELRNTGVLALTPGAGIAIAGTAQNPTIANTGIFRIIPGPGIVSTGGTNPTVSNTGVLDITAGNAGIIVGGNPSNITLTNSGLASLSVGPGLSTTGGLNPTIANTGVITILPGDASVTIAGTPQDRTVSVLVPSISVIYTPSSLSVFTLAPAATGVFVFTPFANTLFTNYLANGSPNPAGVFMIDLSNLIFNMAIVAPIAANRTVTLAFKDTVTNAVYTSAIYLNQSLAVIGTTGDYNFNFGRVYFNVADARTAGMTTMGGFFITNDTTATLTFVSGGTAYAEYYPNGLE
jgi:hypothetical protein